MRLTQADRSIFPRAFEPGVRLGLLAVCLLGIGGCGGSDAEFSLNRIHLRLQESRAGIEYDPRQVEEITKAITDLFGTPDVPRLAAGSAGIGQVVDLARLQAAAGPVGSDEHGQGRGLYRQHCVHCHGVAGDGRGPAAAFLDPYPRDFRRGIFKFKSTPIGFKPTDDDLCRVLRNGISGTAMPSFRLLEPSEIDALVEYVKYLAIRGEVERVLIEDSIDFFEPGDPKASAQLREEFRSPEYLVDEVLSKAVRSWQSAESQVTRVPDWPARYDPSSNDFDPNALEASVDRGRALYHAKIANCFSCHGASHTGDGLVTDYDVWSKEFFDWTREDNDAYARKRDEYLALGGLAPRNIKPRNLRSGVFRGGSRPIDLYWRIHNGIDGTPMPESNKASLADDDIWDLVNYVRALPQLKEDEAAETLLTHQTPSQESEVTEK